MPDFEYRVATVADTEEIINLLARVFSESEPPAVAMGLTFGDMKQFLRLITPEIVSILLTVIAREKGSGELAGALLTDDFALSPQFELDQISSRFAPVFSMLEELDERFRAGRTISPGEYMHLFMLGVNARFTGAGIAKSMVEACLENGLHKRYRTAVTEATGKISQRVFQKNGFVERFAVAYRDFKYEGKAVFASIKEHDRAMLMERVLS